MLNRDPKREQPRTQEEIARDLVEANSARRGWFKQVYRWLNLTIMQQGLWPLLVIVLDAPAGPVGLTPMPWWWARLAGPLLAVLLSLAYLKQSPYARPANDPVPQNWQAQVVIALPTLAVMLAIGRLVQGPWEPAAKVIAVGLAEAVAYQLVNFGVVRRTWPDPDTAELAAIGLFALSWGIYGTLAAGISLGGPELLVALLGGCAIGLVVALISAGVRRIGGGFWGAVSLQFVLVTLVLGWF